MKIICCHLMLVILLVSCQQSPKASSENNDSKGRESSIYQMEVYQMTPDDFKIIYLNRLNGNVYVREMNNYWYNAQTLTDLKIYKKPTYSMKIFGVPGKQFQIALSNDLTGQIYIRANSSWYEASRVSVIK